MYIFKDDSVESGYINNESERHSLIQLNYSLPAYIRERQMLSLISLGNEQLRLSTSSLAAVPKIGVMSLNESGERNMKPVDWIKDYQFYLIWLCYTSSFLIHRVSITYVMYYAELTLLLEKSFIPIVLLVMFSSGFIMAPIVEVYQKHINRNIIFAISCILGLGETSSLIIKIFVNMDW